VNIPKGLTTLFVCKVYITRDPSKKTTTKERGDVGKKRSIDFYRLLI
jgi:hypothetical protein